MRNELLYPLIGVQREAPKPGDVCLSTGKDIVVYTCMVCRMGHVVTPVFENWCLHLHSILTPSGGQIWLGGPVVDFYLFPVHPKPYLGGQCVYSLKNATQFVHIGGNYRYVVDIYKKI